MSMFRKGLSRRRFLQNGGLVGGALLVAPTIAGSPAAAALARTTNRSATPVRGGLVRLGASASPDTFDPAFAVVAETIWAHEHLYSRLTRVNADLSVVGDIAQSWEANETVDAWTFALRPGIRFHHGRELTSADVVATFERMLDEATGSPGRNFYGAIDAIETPDDLTVTFRLAAANADFPYLLGFRYGGILPADRLDTIANEPVGTGPYLLGEHAPGERTTLTRFEDYFAADVEAFLDSVVFQVVPEEQGRVAALRTGDIDVVTSLSAAAFSQLDGQSGIDRIRVESGSMMDVTVQLDQEPFTDIRVVQALKLAAGRPTIIAAAYGGNAVEGADHPISPIMPFHDPNVVAPARDVERARELLAEAGYPDGITLELATSSQRAGMGEVALALQETVRDAGIRIEIRDEPIQTYWSDVWLRRPMFVGNTFGRATPNEILTSHFMSDGGTNGSNLADPELDELIVRGRSVNDADERAEIYSEIQRIVAERSGSLIHSFYDFLAAKRSAVQGFTGHPTGLYRFHSTWIGTE